MLSNAVEYTEKIWKEKEEVPRNSNHAVIGIENCDLITYITILLCKAGKHAYRYLSIVVDSVLVPDMNACVHSRATYIDSSDFNAVSLLNKKLMMVF